jgi:hypothetical protein
MAFATRSKPMRARRGMTVLCVGGLHSAKIWTCQHEWMCLGAARGAAVVFVESQPTAVVLPSRVVVEITTQRWTPE